MPDPSDLFAHDRDALEALRTVVPDRIYRKLQYDLDRRMIAANPVLTTLGAELRARLDARLDACIAASWAAQAIAGARFEPCADRGYW